MDRPKLVDAKAKAELKKRRAGKHVGQRECATRGEVNRSTLARLEAVQGAGFTLPVFVGYCRGIGEQAWRVLRDVEESVYGDD